MNEKDVLELEEEMKNMKTIILVLMIIKKV